MKDRSLVKVGVIGPGAIGQLFAASIRKRTSNIVLIDYQKDRVKHLNFNGISVLDSNLDPLFQSYPEVTVDYSALKECDFVLLATKSYQVDSVGEKLKSIAFSGTLVSLLNGKGYLENLSEKIPDASIYPAVTFHGVTTREPGKIIHAGRGKTILPATEEMELFASILNEAGIETMCDEKIEDEVWKKLIINSGVNAIATILEVKNGKLLELETARELMNEVLLESLRVAKSDGFSDIKFDPIKETEAALRRTSDNFCSMLQDRQRNRQTEIDYINGAIFRTGELTGSSAPLNFTLAQLIKAYPYV